MRTGALTAKAGQRRATLTGIKLGSSGMTAPEPVRNNRGQTLSALSNAFPYQSNASRTPSSGCSVGNPTPRHRPIMNSGSTPARESKQASASAQPAEPADLTSGHPGIGGVREIIRLHAEPRDAGGIGAGHSSSLDHLDMAARQISVASSSDAAHVLVALAKAGYPAAPAWAALSSAVGCAPLRLMTALPLGPVRFDVAQDFRRPGPCWLQAPDTAARSLIQVGSPGIATS